MSLLGGHAASLASYVFIAERFCPSYLVVVAPAVVKGGCTPRSPSCFQTLKAEGPLWCQVLFGEHVASGVPPSSPEDPLCLCWWSLYSITHVLACLKNEQFLLIYLFFWNEQDIDVNRHILSSFNGPDTLLGESHVSCPQKAHKIVRRYFIGLYTNKHNKG